MVSFMLFGCVPLMSYVILINIEFNDFDPKFLISCLLTLITLLLLGAIKVCVFYSNFTIIFPFFFF